MKTISNILLIIILSFIAHLYIPFWWFFIIITFMISFAFGQSAISAFFSGFLAIFILWMALIMYSSTQNDFLLVNKMALLFKIPYSMLLILLSSVIGGLVGGFGSLSGYFLKTISAENY